MDTAYIGKEVRCSKCKRIIYTQSAFFKINGKIVCMRCNAQLGGEDAS